MYSKLLIAGFSTLLLSLAAPSYAACWFFCDEFKVDSVRVLEPNLDDGYQVEICLNQPLGRRDRFYPKLTLSNQRGKTLVTDFILARHSGESKLSACYIRDLLSYEIDISETELDRWINQFSPALLRQIELDLRQKTSISGSLKSIDLYQSQ